MSDGQAVPPPAVTAIAGMLATRYSGQPTQRDLDVAKVAYAAGAAQALADAHLVPDSLIAEATRDERQACARLAEQYAGVWAKADAEAALRELAGVIRARTTP